MNVAEDKHALRKERCNYNGLELETPLQTEQIFYLFVHYVEIAACIFCFSL